MVATIAEVIECLAAKIQNPTLSAIFDKRARILLVGKLKVLLVVARSKRLPVGTLSWKIGRRAVALDSDLILITRMKEGNQSALDYYLLQQAAYPAATSVYPQVSGQVYPPAVSTILTRSRNRFVNTPRGNAHNRLCSALFEALPPRSMLHPDCSCDTDRIGSLVSQRVASAKVPPKHNCNCKDAIRISHLCLLGN